MRRTSPSPRSLLSIKAIAGAGGTGAETTFAVLLLLLLWTLLPHTVRARGLSMSNTSAEMEHYWPTVFPDAPGLDDQAPYSGWKTHVASQPEEAVVLVRRQLPGGGAACVTGLVVRCDGFVLVPKLLRDAAFQKETVEVVVAHADGLAPKETAVARAMAHPYVLSTLGYALLKINDYHVPGLPLLDAGSVVPGEKVRVLTAVPEGAEGVAPTGFQVAAQTATVGTRTAQRDEYELAGRESDAPLPVGAVVVDAESGGAVGMVTGGSAAAPVFTTFARLHAIVAEVAIAPDRTAVRLGNRNSPAPIPPEMVWIPGGPTRLSGAAGYRHQRAYGTDVVCTPGFYANAYPITNGQYRTWLATTDKRSIHAIPAGWPPLELQEPQLRSDLPACGMSFEDADAYAVEHGVRLLTEAEWYHARRVTKIEWAQAADDRLNQMSLQIFQVFQARNARTVQATMDAAKKVESRHPNATTIRALPPDDGSDFSNLYQGIAALNRSEMRFWRSPHPFGLYPDDVSVYGLHEVVSNPREILQGNRYLLPIGEKPAPAEMDPVFTIFDWTSTGVLDPDGEREFYRQCFLLLAWHNEWEYRGVGFNTGATGGNGWATTWLAFVNLTMHSGRAEATGSFTYGHVGETPVSEAGWYSTQITTQAPPTFRCAR